MAKKSKSKNSSSSVLPPIEYQAVDDDLMDDLLAELDSRDQTVQVETAAVLNEITVNQVASPSPEPESKKLDAKGRYKARQVSNPMAVQCRSARHNQG